MVECGGQDVAPNLPQTSLDWGVSLVRPLAGRRLGDGTRRLSCFGNVGRPDEVAPATEAAIPSPHGGRAGCLAAARDLLIVGRRGSCRPRRSRVGRPVLLAFGAPLRAVGLALSQRSLRLASALVQPPLVRSSLILGGGCRDAVGDRRHDVEGASFDTRRVDDPRRDIVKLIAGERMREATG